MNTVASRRIRFATWQRGNRSFVEFGECREDPKGHGRLAPTYLMVLNNEISVGRIIVFNVYYTE